MGDLKIRTVFFSDFLLAEMNLSCLAWGPRRLSRCCWNDARKKAPGPTTELLLKNCWSAWHRYSTLSWLRHVQNVVMSTRYSLIFRLMCWARFLPSDADCS